MVKLKVLLQLGLWNVICVAFYRLSIKLKINSALKLRCGSPEGDFFSLPRINKATELLPVPQAWFGKINYFGYFTIELKSSVPDWHFNPFIGKKVTGKELDWWKISDFDSDTGDIKVIWELSRFYWVLAFSQRAAQGDSAALDKLNVWLKDWCDNNRPYKGVNWKCGQEASVRVMHLAMAALIMDQHKQSTHALKELIALHLKRIRPTLRYAIAQNNNHGTSEAAALFIGGSFLAINGDERGKHWERVGRKWLENRVDKLIQNDGSFSQYSLTYHRVVLDTLSMVEVWRRNIKLSGFSHTWVKKAKAASKWLFNMIDPVGGDGPNLGANDGARLLQLSETGYRDFRPSVQLAMALFENYRAYEEEGSWNLPLYWLGIELPTPVLEKPESQLYGDGGFAIVRQGSALAVLRFPRFRFRPSQADALHLDLWLGSRNILRDAGTFSYNADAFSLNYFPGTISHNTVQFDDRDQMPRLSRFLFGSWLKTSYLEPITKHDDGMTCAAGYVDGHHAMHNRHIRLKEHSITVNDRIEGFRNRAVLRWRLEPGQWHADGNRLSNGRHVIEVCGSMPILRFELVTGWESRYYFVKDSVPVLEIEVDQAGLLTTEYHWNL